LKPARLAAAAMAAALGLPNGATAQAIEQAVLGQCSAELGLTIEECACTLETARPQLSERQIAYFLVRIARDEAEVARMRTFRPLRERLPILFIIMRAVEFCAPGKDVDLPAS
jgi:hypothetical protein